MTIIKAVLGWGFFFILIKSSYFQVFPHSYMRLLPPSLAPRLSSPPSVLASAHMLTCPFSLTPALPSAPALWKILLTCQKGRRPRASLQKAAPSSHFPGPSHGSHNAKTENEAMLWRNGKG